MNEIRKCPFCDEGEMIPTRPTFTYWHKYPRGYRNDRLQALECNKCGIIVFRRGESVKWSRTRTRKEGS